MPPKKPLRSSKNTKDLTKTSKHKKMTDWACHVPSLLRRWVGKSRKITIVADSAFACFKFAHACINHQVSLISRLRLDARLYDFIPINPRVKRKRVVGKVLPKLSVLAENPLKEWDEATVSWYGGVTKTVFIQSGTCLWYYIGFCPVPIRWVLIKGPYSPLRSVFGRLQKDRLSRFAPRT